jgi:hypothetical protein
MFDNPGTAGYNAVAYAPKSPEPAHRSDGLAVSRQWVNGVLPGVPDGSYRMVEAQPVDWEMCKLDHIC